MFLHALNVFYMSVGSYSHTRILPVVMSSQTLDPPPMSWRKIVVILLLWRSCCDTSSVSKTCSDWNILCEWCCLGENSILFITLAFKILRNLREMLVLLKKKKKKGSWCHCLWKNNKNGTGCAALPVIIIFFPVISKSILRPSFCTSVLINPSLLNLCENRRVRAHSALFSK